MKKKNKIKNIRFIFIAFIFLIIFSIGTTSSRYLSTATTEVDIIAKSILTLSNDKLTYTEPNLLPGDTKTYEFSVSNYDGVNTNEVLMKYYLEITTDATKTPLEVSIQNVNTGEILSVNNGRTAEIELPYGSEVTTNYKLILKWDKSKSDVSFAGLNMKYTIKLVATQKRMRVE